MIKKYILFKENMDQAKSIMAKKMDSYEKLKKLLSRNMGYIGKFTEYLMYENISYDDLVELYNKLMALKSKNKNININNLKYEKLLDTILITENDIKVYNLINKFPSEQKEIAKSMFSTGKDINRNSYYNIFLKISNKKNINAFISKISRYKSKDELYNAASIFSKDSSNSKEEVKDKLKDLKSKLIFENDDTLLIQVVSNADLKILASDASWCILSPSTWSTYVSNGRKQFMLIDYSKDEFDPEFKIGFTLNTNGSIHAAHDILDKKFSDKLQEVLDIRGLNTSKLMEVEPITELGKSNSLQHIKDFINTAEYDIIKNNASKILNKLGYGGKSNGFNLTPGKSELILKLIVKIFKPYTIINKENIENIDIRLYQYFCYNESSINISNKFIREDIMKLSNKTFEAIKYGLSIWTDEIIVKFSNNINPIFKINKNYSKFEESNFTIDKKSLELVQDRMYTIYKSKNVELNDSFNEKLVLISYAIGKGSSLPKELLKYVSSAKNIQYPGLFNIDIDISNMSFFIGIDFPIGLIKKKDYTDSNLSISNTYCNIIIPRLLRHLKGFKIKIKVLKNQLASIIHTLLNNDDPYNKFFLSTLRMLPTNSRVGRIVENGNLIIELA